MPRIIVSEDVIEGGSGDVGENHEAVSGRGKSVFHSLLPVPSQLQSEVAAKLPAETLGSLS
jgi:hypothetical protein